MAKVTSSSNRSKRKPAKPRTITKGQNPQRANRQAVSTARVSQSGQAKPGSAASRVTTGRGSSSPSLPKVPKPQMKPGATTTNTLRATGAGGPAKIQRLAAQASSAQRMANRTARGYGKPGGLERGIKGSAQLMALKEGLTARNTAPGTISSMDPKLARRIEGMQKSGKQWAAQERKARAANAKRGSGTFDSAFKDARKAGVKTFTWRGKKYTTKMKGE